MGDEDEPHDPGRSCACRTGSSASRAVHELRSERIGGEGPGGSSVPDRERELATPRPGATAVSDDLSGRLASAAPKPVDRIVIDRPVKMASAPREITPSSCDSIDATSRIPTPALPPIPCTRPMANEPRFVRARCGSPCSVLLSGDITYLYLLCWKDMTRSEPVATRPTWARQDG